MLKWIVGSKADHPLADIRQVRDMLAELPANDSVKSLSDITGWLESVVDVDSFKLDRLYELIDTLDTAAKTPQLRVVQDYLGMSRQQKFQENKLWTAGARFAKALADAYAWFLKQYESGASGALMVRKWVPVACARALRGRAQELKWIMLRYGRFEPRVWASIASLYGLAESGKFADAPVAIYPGQHGSGTAQQEYLKALMLWAASADVLPPLRQEVAERMVQTLSRFFILRSDAFPGALYAFDPKGDRPPARLFGSPSLSFGVHYFGPGAAREKVADAIAVLEKTGVLPTDLYLGRPYPAEIVLTVLKHLALYWAENPPTRASERRAASGRITVVPGYLPLLDELEREESDALNFTESTAESWVVENVSENGYGAIVPATAADWLRVGELIGVQVEGATGWGVSIIRRVARDEQRQYRVGIEVLSHAVVAVELSRATGGETEHGVLLSTRPDSHGEVAIIRRAGRYDSKVGVQLAVGDKSYTLTPSRLIDGGDDYDRASYKIARTN